MNLAQSSRTSSPLSRLQRLARPRATQERCELCGATIAAEHQHLLELHSRQLHCACEACAVLFSGDDNQRYRRVSRRVTRLDGIEPSDSMWEDLNIPINLAFFYHSSQSGKVVAMYPSPAGATESQIPNGAWEELQSKSKRLQNMKRDVEALIINHVGHRRDCFLVSIDECYRLVGLIRSNWRGLSGGREVWKAISEFFDGLQRRAGASGGMARA